MRTTSLLEVQHVEYLVVLPRGLSALYEPIGHTDPDVALSIEPQPDKEGRNTFLWRANCLPSFKEVGIRLELE